MASIPSFSPGVSLRSLQRAVLNTDLLALWDGSQWLYGTFEEFGLAPSSQTEITTSEALAAGAIVNVWSSGGAKVRNANATDDTMPAHGFVLAAVGSGEPASVIFEGVITGLSGLTPGLTYFLDVTDGLITATAPSTGGNVDQVVGFALSATSLLFRPSQALGV